MRDWIPPDVERADWQRYDVEPGESPRDAVVLAVSAMTNVPPSEMPPLYDVLNPGPLDRILTHAASKGTDMYVRFEFDDCRVVVTPCSVHVRLDDTER